MDKVLAIFDSDSIYATRFMEYLKKRKDFDFDVIVFTRKDSLEEYLKNHRIELLLLGEGIDSGELAKDNIKYLYRLSERPVKDKGSEYPLIYKYRQAQEVIAEIISSYAKSENQTAPHVNAEGPDIITVFVPAPDEDKLTFAWSLAILLSERRKVLFIPLELLPIPVILNVPDSSQELSEFIYYLKEENPNIIMKMKSLLEYSGNLSILRGLSHGFDIQSLTKEDLITWTCELRAHTDYEVVVFYAEHYSDPMTELIRQSDVVYVPLLNRSFDKELIKECERQMDFIGMDIKNKLCKMIIPREECLNGKGITLQELQTLRVWSIAKQCINDL